MALAQNRTCQNWINLYEQGAAVVALDTIQAEADRTSPSMLAEKLGEVPEPLLNEYGYADWDEFFADVLSQTPTVLALGADPNGDPDVQSPLSVASIGAEARTILPNFPGSAALYPNFDKSQRAWARSPSCRIKTA